MRDFMLDLESLATTPDAIIWSIGGCFFDRTSGDIGDKFYMRVNPDCKYNRTRLRTTSTMKFWSDQPQAARNELDMARYSENSLLDGLLGLGRLLNIADLEVWANGTTFDISALEHAYKQVGLPVPWRYDAMRDMRTLRKLNLVDPSTIPDSEIAHHALHDAMWQANYTAAVLQKIEHLKSLDSKAEWL